MYIHGSQKNPPHHHTIYTNIALNFFEESKNHFIKSLFIEYDTSGYCYYNLIHHEQVTKEKISIYIKDDIYNNIGDNKKRDSQKKLIERVDELYILHYSGLIIENNQSGNAGRSHQEITLQGIIPNR